MIRTIYIKLKRVSTVRSRNFPDTSPDAYSVESLKNAAKVNIGHEFFRVGDKITAKQADELCNNLNYEVTVVA